MESIEELVVNMKNEHMRFQCEICGVVADNMDELYAHKNTMHEGIRMTKHIVIGEKETNREKYEDQGRSKTKNSKKEGKEKNGEETKGEIRTKGENWRTKEKRKKIKAR